MKRLYVITIDDPKSDPSRRTDLVHARDVDEALLLGFRRNPTAKRISFANRSMTDNSSAQGSGG